ncbi:hypothetical protein E2562_037918 [Oryza meyeriana var. granulata]|uniref:Uncharacterized protein n=1 Tax=Oryza meyeriana var. granulata TaxID=110450 RepID=A0A6G1E975_9ORYZ|nr:hypothetical protein E2562_037918 [Oryza meyeriana var. granulata]
MVQECRPGLAGRRRGHSWKLQVNRERVLAMEEFQEADILWPDTAALSSQDGAHVVAAPSEMCYDLAAPCCSVSSGTSLFGRCSEGFLSGAPSTAGASNDDEELMEADVLWPDATQPDEQPRWGARGYHGWSRGDLGLAGRRAKPAAAAARREGWRPAASSPIDIPAKAAARCR